MQDKALQEESGKRGRKVDIIWNTTRVCPWDCDICCVDAIEVTRQQEFIQIKSRALKDVENLERRDTKRSIFDEAAAKLQAHGLELDLEGKMRVLDNIAGFDVKLDISGGDPLVISDNFILLQEASRRLGRKQITLTTTGTGLLAGRHDVQTIANLIGEMNFTYDSVLVKGNKTRPDGYAGGNLRIAEQFVRAGVLTRAECPLTMENIDVEKLRRLYVNLHHAGIHKLLLMRLFAVGRGIFDSAMVPSPDQYRKAINVLREMETQYGLPVLRLQCALKHFDGLANEENPCDLVRESFGLMADGTLLASPWAVGGEGGPLDETFVLGNLARTPLREILDSTRVREYENRQDENFGHCKIQAFLASKKKNSFDRIFDRTDPLYVNNEPRLNKTISSIEEIVSAA